MLVNKLCYRLNLDRFIFFIQLHSLPYYRPWRRAFCLGVFVINAEKQMIATHRRRTLYLYDVRLLNIYQQLNVIEQKLQAVRHIMVENRCDVLISQTFYVRIFLRVCI